MGTARAVGVVDTAVAAELEDVEEFCATLQGRSRKKADRKILRERIVTFRSTTHHHIDTAGIP
jgi:hypothetical protein